MVIFFAVQVGLQQQLGRSAAEAREMGRRRMLQEQGRCHSSNKSNKELLYKLDITYKHPVLTLYEYAKILTEGISLIF